MNQKIGYFGIDNLHAMSKAGDKIYSKIGSRISILKGVGLKLKE